MSVVHRMLNEWDHGKKQKKRTKRRVKRTKKTRKAWDDTTSDLSKLKLTPRELREKRARNQSKHKTQARSLIRDSKRNYISKKRNEEKQKKQKAIKKWEKRLNKKSKASKDLESTESSKDASSGSGSEMRKSSQTSSGGDTNNWEWSGNSSMDALDDKLTALQDEFYVFEKHVKKSLRQKNTKKEADAGPVPVESDPEKTWRDQLTKLTEVQNKHISSLTTQVNTMASQINNLQHQVEMLQRQTQSRIPYQAPPMTHLNYDTDHFSLSSVPSGIHSRETLSCPEYKSYEKTDVLSSRSFIPSNPINFDTNYSPDVFSSTHTPFSSTLVGRKFDDALAPVVITSGLI